MVSGKRYPTPVRLLPLRSGFGGCSIAVPRPGEDAVLAVKRFGLCGGRGPAGDRRVRPAESPLSYPFRAASRSRRRSSRSMARWVPMQASPP